MVSSMVLLMVLQLLWLKSSYERAFFGLRRDSNFIFRNTLHAMRDTLYQGNIRVVGPGADSLPKLQGPDLQAINIVKKNPDSVVVSKSSTVQVFISEKADNKDSILDAIRPMTRQLRQSIEAGQRSFFIRLAPDTVSLDTLKLYFDAALQKANIPLEFVIEHQTTDPEKFPIYRDRPDSNDGNDNQLYVYSDTIQLDSLRFNPMSRYNASVFPVQSFILRQIAPQILFSFLLTIITLIAFVILYRNVRAQQRLMELKNDFISNVTHELKTPVATVSVALEALKSFHALNNPKLTNEYLDIARNELNRLTLMTDKILKAAVFENKGITIQRERVDLYKNISQILDSMRLIFEKRQALVSFNLQGESFTLEGEQAHITNVIYNLLDNALKYSPKQPVIAINLKETSDEQILSIRDEGIGIPDEYKNKIFEKFFRVPTGDIHTIKGYGLGLSYVAGVVKAHNGSIKVESESGKGSTFIIHWPKHHA